MEKKTTKIIAYKGFDKDLKCRGMQYEVGKTYEMPEDKIAVCRAGFHACESPLDVLGYYPMFDADGNVNRFCEVEQEGRILPSTAGSKTCSSKIKIKAEIGIKGLIHAGIEWLKEETRPDKIASAAEGDMNDDGRKAAQIGSSGNEAQIGSSGDWAQIGSSGDGAQIGSSGDCAKIGSSGDWAKIGSSGDWAKIGSSGNEAQIGSSGNGAQIGSSGDWAQIGSSGNEAQIGSSGNGAQIGSSGNGAQIGSSGNGAQIGSSGKHSVICCAGHGSQVKAKRGSWVTLAEWVYDETKGRHVPLKVVSFQIDGEIYKEDTWYVLRNGEIVECKRK